jgi:hypothetical protein
MAQKVMAQLKRGEDATLRARLDAIAAAIEQQWTPADIERIEPIPPYLGNVSLASLEGYAKFIVRGTGGAIAIHKGWGDRLIHHVCERKK